MNNPEIQRQHELLLEIQADLVTIMNKLQDMEKHIEEHHVYIQKCKERDERILRKKQEKRAILGRYYD